MPRSLALAERAGVADRPGPGARRRAGGAPYAQDWSRFVHQVGRQVLPRLDAEGPALNYRIPPPGLKRGIGGAFHANHPLPGFVLRYTTDGSEPTLSSLLVMAPSPPPARAGGGLNTLGRRSVGLLDPAERSRDDRQRFTVAVATRFPEPLIVPAPHCAPLTHPRGRRP